MFNRFKNIYILISILNLIVSAIFFTSQTYVGKLGGILIFLTFLLNVRLAFKKAHEVS